MTARDQLVEDVYRTLAAQIRSERERQKLSMLTVAERAGLSQQMVSYLERGMRNPSLGTLIRVCEVLNLSLPQLLGDAMARKG